MLREVYTIAFSMKNAESSFCEIKKNFDIRIKMIFSSLIKKNELF